MTDETRALLDRTLQALQQDDAVPVVHTLILGLHAIRAVAGPARWGALVEEVCRPHPLREVLQEDPFTARSVGKPRGYAGDAVLIDYIYEGLPPELAARTSRLGQRIFSYTAGCSESARSVRWRRDHVAHAVDAVAGRVHRSRILSVACGHLSEAACSEAVRSGAVGEYVALDHDEQTLQELRLAHPEACIVPRRASVQDLISGKCELGRFDLIYSAGLYDYLRQPAAQALTAILFERLEAGGQLLIGNFVPDFGTAGYMEAFMDWKLIGRGPADMEGLCARIPAREVGERREYSDENGYVTYLDLRRGAQPG